MDSWKFYVEIIVDFISFGIKIDINRENLEFWIIICRYGKI